MEPDPSYPPSPEQAVVVVMVVIVAKRDSRTREIRNQVIPMRGTEEEARRAELLVLKG